MNEFIPNRIVRTYTQIINANPEKIFPLLCPVREQYWLDGWKCKVLFAETGYAEKNGVYSTQHPGEEDTIWMITDRDEKNHKIEFVYFIPGIRVTRLNIAVNRKDINTSEVHIRYIYTSISEKGNLSLETDYSKEEFIKKMKHWETVMNYYLETGNKLVHE